VPLGEDLVRTSCAGKRGSPGVSHGKITDIDGEVVTVRKADGNLARFRTHDPALLSAIVKRRGAKVTVNDQYCIMRAGITRSGSTCVSVQADRDEPLEPCKIGDLPPSAGGLDPSGGDDGGHTDG
jgi:hypothetical protein